MPTPANRPLSILIVDDVADAADSLAVLLRLHGFAVRTAPDAPAALQSTLADPPDVILTDLAMPGMSGWELAARVRAECPRPPVVVAVSGYGRDEDRSRSAEAGIAAHLIKPVDPAALLAVLNRVRPAAPRTMPGAERRTRRRRRAEVVRRVVAIRAEREEIAVRAEVVCAQAAAFAEEVRARAAWVRAVVAAGQDRCRRVAALLG